MLNKVQLIGNLGRDPEIKTLNSGAKVANMALATSRRWKDRNTGEMMEHTEWHRIVVWAEHSVNYVERYLRKGSKVYVEGANETRKWQDQAGEDRYSTEVVVRPYGGTVTGLDKASDNGGQSNAGQGSQDRDSGGSYGGGGGYGQSGGNGNNSSIGGGDYDDEIPF